MTIRVLVSVRSVAEAHLVATGGANFIDLKEPGQGALGGLPLPVLRSILAALQAQGCRLPVSATIGDVAMHAMDDILQRVQAVGACGVDYVKVGITRTAGAAAVLDALAGCGLPVVPVFIADQGVDGAQWQRALGLGFAGVMVDTADKRAGSLFDVMTDAELAALVAAARAAGVMVGLAGALRLGHVDRLVALAPDFAGFRSAVCDGDRSGALVAERLLGLVRALAVAQGGAPGGACSRLPTPAVA